MAPNVTKQNGTLLESDDAQAHTQMDDICVAADADAGADADADNAEPAQLELQLVWRKIIGISVLHLAGIYGAYLFFTSAKWQTNVYAYVLATASGLGISAGVHRLWTHRAYKAKWPLRLILMVLNTLAFQQPAIEWARDHRMHHKYLDTDADPYNATRGFFFSHVGWLMVRKHPDIKLKGKDLDLSDLYADPILRFQKKYYLILMPLICFILPTLVPVYLWGETWSNSFFVATVFRYIYNLNVIFLVNSAAHKWGNKPYDKNITPTQNVTVDALTLGEGFHNYHHAFPWDYNKAELGNNRLNITTAFIHLFARIGWAYDLKTVSDEIVRQRVKRTGDGSHHLWGWGDKNIPQEEIDHAIRINRKDD